MRIEFDTDMDEWDYVDAKDELVLAFETLGDTLAVEGSNIGWTHSTGSGTVESHMAWGFLGINGDYRLVAEVSDHAIAVIRYSHDEPTGALFSFARADDTPEI